MAGIGRVMRPGSSSVSAVSSASSVSMVVIKASAWSSSSSFPKACVSPASTCLAPSPLTLVTTIASNDGCRCVFLRCGPGVPV